MSEFFCTCITFTLQAFNLIKRCRTYFCLQNHSLVGDGRITFVRESIQGDEQTTVSFRTTPEIMADVLAYDPKELLVILFNQVANFLSVGNGISFDSVQSLAISLCPFRPTIGAGSYIQTPKSLHSNILNLNDDYCFL